VKVSPDSSDLETVLQGDGRHAYLVVSALENLLHNFLNRVGRVSTDEEKEWQNRERERCLNLLVRRFEQPSGDLLKARIFDALRSAIAINCPQRIQEGAKAALDNINISGAVAVIDAICTADHDLPILTTEFNATEYEKPIIELMSNARCSLERLSSNPAEQARIVIEKLAGCIAARVRTNGFDRFMIEFRDRPDFLVEMANQLEADPRLQDMVYHLSCVLQAVHIGTPAVFRDRARAALQSHSPAIVDAISRNLRVFEYATEEDVAAIQAYGSYSDPDVKRGALFAIAYMGKFVDLRDSLKKAALSIHAEGDASVACSLADAFGPYGVPLTALTRHEAAALSSEFLLVKDWEVDQGGIPRFLNRLLRLFPDEVFDLLRERVELSDSARQKHEFLRTFGLVHERISFEGVPTEKRLELGRQCLALQVKAHDSAHEYAELFWDVVGFDESALRLILEVVPKADERGVENLATLIDAATPRLAFTNPEFAKELIQQFTGPQRERIIDALAHQARRLGTGGVFAGNPSDFMAERDKQFAEQVASFPDEPGLEDLARALGRLT
jgi:hypothetical protein